jgi:hypothetical protein
MPPGIIDRHLRNIPFKHVLAISSFTVLGIGAGDAEPCKPSSEC